MSKGKFLTFFTSSKLQKHLNNYFHKMIWKNFKKKKVLGLIALTFLSVGGISFKLSQRNISNKDITEFTIAAESGSLPGLITASGELKANKSVNVSPKRQGILENLIKYSLPLWAHINALICF